MRCERTIELKKVFMARKYADSERVTIRRLRKSVYWISRGVYYFLSDLKVECSKNMRLNTINAGGMVASLLRLNFSQ